LKLYQSLQCSQSFPCLFQSHLKPKSGRAACFFREPLVSQLYSIHNCANCLSLNSNQDWKL
jgi:hypothetical protein